jgi:hypothetical protein
LDGVKAINKKATGRHTDWRLPNIRELETLVDIHSHAPAVPPKHPFAGTAEGYWSSTTSVYEPSYAWVLYTLDGSVGVGFKAKANFLRSAGAPPLNQRDDVVHHTCEEAEADDEHFDGKTTEWKNGSVSNQNLFIAPSIVSGSAPY